MKKLWRWLFRHRPPRPNRKLDLTPMERTLWRELVQSYYFDHKIRK